MTTTLLRVPRRAATAALAGLALTPLAACGGDEATSAGAGDGLARLAPPTSIFYAEAAIRPQGDMKADLDALVAKFAPGQTTEGLVAKAFRDSSDKVDFKRDIEPWLGERAAVAVTGVQAAGSGDPDVAALVETTDPEKALATVRKGVDGKLADRSHAGVDYLFDAADKSAAGIVDDTLVGGTEAAFKAVVDASEKGGLSGNDRYTKVVDAVDDDAFGFLYGDVRRVLELAQRAGPADATPQQLEGIRELFDRRGVSTFAAGLVATDKAVTLRAAAPTKAGGDAATADAVAALPAGAWAALGLGDLGKSISEGLDGVKSLAGPGFDVQSGLDQLEQQAGIDVQKDLLSWMGQTGLFARGTSLTDIGGALVVESKDPAATKAALAKARTIVADAGLPAEPLSGNGIDDGFSVTPGNTPIQVFAALAGNRFVLAIGRPALDAAINPAGKLGDDASFKAAAELLGEGMRPTFFLDFPKVSGLIGLAASGQPSYAEAKRYLDRITTITAGSKREGDLQLQSFVVGIR